MAPEQEKKSKVEYTAQAVSPIVNGEVKLKVGENSFTAEGVLDTAEVPYSNVNAMEFKDYVVTVRADDGDFIFSRMGSWAQPFYDALCEAYNNAMLRAFFVSGGTLFTASGDYRFTEDNKAAAGKTPVRVYGNCVVALPPDGNARRIPFCFVNGMEKNDLEVTLKLNLGESYTFSRLGYNTAGFADAAEKQIRAVHEKAITVFKDIDPMLTVSQASQIAKLMSEGAAAPMGQLAAIAPSFAAALQEKMTAARSFDTYKAFAEVCDPAQIWIGFKKNDIRAEAKKGAAEGTPGMPAGMPAGMPKEVGGLLSSMQGLMGGMAAGGAAAPPASPAAEGKEDEPERDPYLFWMIAPSPNGQYAAVEFAVKPGEYAATFVYRTNGDISGSAAYLNRALEAIDFKREVIPMTEEEIRKPENADYYMAAKHTSAMQHIRKNFIGRVIHYTAESWKRDLTEMWSAEASPQAQMQPQPQAQKRFCTACGAEVPPDSKFCGKCGNKA